ncbi:MAG: RAD55 family ATPase [Candidatus Bathyarchaeota archaeon]|nr:RAD55 family ATPase [Candidatus Bathyarchaeota archaeon]
MTPKLMPSGIKPLDTALHGGFSKPANFLLVGPPLSAKKEVGLTLLNGGLERGEAVIYISTSNTAEEIRSHWEEYGFRTCWEQEDKVKFVDCYSKMLNANVSDTPSIRRVPSILDYNKLAVSVNEWCAGYYLKNVSVRMMLDSLSAFLIYSSLQTVMRFLHIFLGQLRKQNVLGFFLLEEGAHDPVTFNQLKTFSNGAIRVNSESNKLQLEGHLGNRSIPIPEIQPVQKMEDTQISCLSKKAGE